LEVSRWIEVHLTEHGDEILAALMPLGFHFKDDDEGDGCGPTAILGELGRLLFASIFHVGAMPNRPVRQLIDVLTKVAAKPEMFCRDYQLLEQEAVAVLVNEYNKLSTRHMTTMLRFLAGRRVMLSSKSVSQAARNAVDFLKPQVRRGPPKDLPQLHLAMALGKFYLKYNPTLGRRVDGVEETGRFKAFVSLVLAPYVKFARPVGRTATVDNIVRRMSDRVNRRPAIKVARGSRNTKIGG
jgi:hypothetical protein